MKKEKRNWVCPVKEIVSFKSIQIITHQIVLILAQSSIYDFCCESVGLQLGGGVICVALPWQTGGH